MPNLDFYATPTDHEQLLNWLFAERTCRVYELESEFHKPLKQFSTAKEVLSEFDRVYSNGKRWHTVHLQLYVIGAGPRFRSERIGSRFRALGWGLVQLYLATPTTEGLEASHTNHLTQKGAANLAPINQFRAWDFRRVQQFS